ncbi:hypothetical protein [Streptomyces sp. NPDC090057]
MRLHRQRRTLLPVRDEHPTPPELPEASTEPLPMSHEPHGQVLGERHA